jgi:hypothetical protein
MTTSNVIFYFVKNAHCSVWDWNMGCDWDGYVNTEYMGEDNIKKDTRTGGRARIMESKDWSGIEGAV